jgi:HlyD family secretion protein
MKRWVIVAAGVVIVAALGLGARAATGVLAPAASAVPTARVVRGAVSAGLVATGEIRPVKTDALMVPPVGAQLRILTLLGSGTHVKKGDVVATFDPTEQEFALEDQRSTLREAELEIARTESASASRKAQDDLDLLTARFDLRKAELDLQAGEVRPELEKRKAALTLEEARRRLQQLEGDRASRSESDQAALAVAREKETKARFAIARAQQTLGQMVLRASIDGVVSVKDNTNTNFFTTGMTFNEYRPGDQVRGGSVVAEVLDLSQLEVNAAIDEGERARLAPGQPATLVLDALGGRTLKATVSSVGNIRAQGFFGSGGTPSRTFDATLALVDPSPDLRPGFTGRLTIAGTSQPNVLHVPRSAVFTRDGATVVFARAGGTFTATPVQVLSRTETWAIVDGVAEGTEIALADPARRAGTASTPAPAGPAIPAAAPGGRR